MYSVWAIWTNPFLFCCGSFYLSNNPPNIESTLNTALFWGIVAERVRISSFGIKEILNVNLSIATWRQIGNFSYSSIDFTIRSLFDSFKDGVFSDFLIDFDLGAIPGKRTSPSDF